VRGFTLLSRWTGTKQCPRTPAVLHADAPPQQLAVERQEFDRLVIAIRKILDAT
jgi:hypothetical protein